MAALIVLHLDVLLSFDLVLLGFAFEIVDQICDNLRAGLSKLNVLQMDLSREDAPLAFHGRFLEFEAGNPALALFQFCKEVSRGPLVWLGQSRRCACQSRFHIDVLIEFDWHELGLLLGEFCDFRTDIRRVKGHGLHQVKCHFADLLLLLLSFLTVTFQDALELVLNVSEARIFEVVRFQIWASNSIEAGSPGFYLHDSLLVDQVCVDQSSKLLDNSVRDLLGGLHGRHGDGRYRSVHLLLHRIRASHVHIGIALTCTSPIFKSTFPDLSFMKTASICQEPRILSLLLRVISVLFLRGPV